MIFFSQSNLMMFGKYRIRENSLNTSKSREVLRLSFSLSNETGLSDLMEDFDFEDVNYTGYERDINVEIIDGFYYQNVALMNDKVRLFADY